MMLEVDDIQHFLISRHPALTARCEFLTFRRHASGREWLKGLVKRVGTARTVVSEKPGTRWVTIGFTWNGLRALGVNEAALTTFPEEFRQGMAARAEILGSTGANHPEKWVGGLASQDLHAIVLLFARDGAERERRRQEHREYLMDQCDGVKVLSSLDLEAILPFAYAQDHFGYRDLLSQPCIEELGEEPTPDSGAPIKAGEFFLGYPDEEGPTVGLPQPEVLSRNGSYVAYLRIEEHVRAFRSFLREHGETSEPQEWIAAKLMGPWSSGAPLDLLPHRDDPGPGSDMQRRRVISRVGAYGPPLPEDGPDDGIERGTAVFVGCASLVRQFEFAMDVWANDHNFHELVNERDPNFGTQGYTNDVTIRKKIIGLPSFTNIRGGAYFFLPGIRALRYLAALS